MTKITPLPTHRLSWRRLAWPAYIRRLQHSDRPILVGPWRGEIGFEALYWTAFLDALVEIYGIDRERFVPITRGGAGAWYGVPKSIELFSMRTPQQVRVQNRVDVARTGILKQERITDWDRAVLRDAAETLNLTNYHVLHPAWLYHALAPFWTGHTGLEWLKPWLRFRPLTATAPGMGISLPTDFVAVRFYARQTFAPSDKGIYPFMEAVLQQLTQTANVVILDSDLYLDDHADIAKAMTGPRILHLKDLVELTPENNLLWMSAVLQQAQGFVGTYGGFAQLALRMQKPSVSFYVDWHNATSIAHKALADALSLQMNIPAIVLSVAQLAMLQTVLPEVVLRPSAPKLQLASK